MSADAYFARLSGWQAEAASQLRRLILNVDEVVELLKWGQPIYESPAGPICLIKAHKAHIALGFWRGAQMTDLDSRLAPGGSYKMATIRIESCGEIDEDQVRLLVESGVALNRLLGDPLKEAKH